MVSEGSIGFALHVDLFYILNIFGVGVFGLQVYLCIIYVSGALRGQKKMSDLLKLELQLVIKHYVGAENWAR